MLQAQLGGKLSRREENLEDLLTSNVFGTLEYIPFETGLQKVLESIIDDEGPSPIKKSVTWNLSERFTFWPLIQEGGCLPCYPDVAMTMTEANGKKTLIFVESKFQSGKSPRTDEDGMFRDQLVVEWDNLVSRSERLNATPVLIYVTADLDYPKEDVEGSKDDFRKYSKYRNDPQHQLKVNWFSWRGLPRIIENSMIGKVAHQQRNMLEDLAHILRDLGLSYYEGFEPCKLTPINWSFDHSE